MTDRALLEMAAKAAGLPIGWDSRGAYIVAECITGASDVWNPLTDDADALRLAVKLALDVSQWTITDHFTMVSGAGARAKELHDRDPYAATRRAIVRAAAIIGEKQ